MMSHTDHSPCKREGLYSGLLGSAGSVSSSSAGPALEPEERLKMVLDICCQRERLYKSLYVVQTFVLAGVAYYCCRGSAGKPALDHDAIAGDSWPPVGETLRLVWGPMDKCYPVTIQRHRVKSGKKQDSEAVTPKAVEGGNGAAPKEETGTLSQDEGQARSPGEEAASPTPAGKEVAEGHGKVPKETAVYPSEASEAQSKDERSRGWTPQLLRKLWRRWFPAPVSPDARKRRRQAIQ